jgi:hypothetical protein
LAGNNSQIKFGLLAFEALNAILIGLETNSLGLFIV